MNKTKIEWVRHSNGSLGRTWNPVTGCEHGCPYCYARKQAMRFTHHFQPTFHPDRLGQPWREKKPQRVFVCSMADLFGEWVPDEWIKQVFAACKAAPQHSYYFLTKNPARYRRAIKITPPANWWFGASCHDFFTFSDRFYGSGLFLNENNFISLEPFLENHICLETKHPEIDKPPRWIIVGAQTRPTILPEREWVLDMRQQCQRLSIPLFETKSLAPLKLPGGLRQETVP